MEILLIEDNPNDAKLFVDLCNLEFKKSKIKWATSLSDGVSEIQNN